MSNLSNEKQPMDTQRIYGKKNAKDRELERRERLLEAALQLFATQGYANTTIEVLCSEAKVTTRHFYQAFSGREAVLLSLFNQMMDELQVGILTSMMNVGNSMQEKLQQIIHALVYHYLTDTRRAKVGVLEVVGASPVIERRRREVIHTISTYIQVFLDQLALQNEIPKRNYHWVAVAIVGGINELMAEWLMNPQLSLEQLTEEMMFTAEVLIQGVKYLPIKDE